MPTATVARSRPSIALAMLLAIAMTIPWPATADPGGVEVLDADHHGPISITEPGTTLDCAGHSVQGPGEGVGISIEADGVIVSNCTVLGFDVGIATFGTAGGILDGNTALGGAVGFELVEAQAYTLVGNRAEDAEESGFRLAGTTNSSLRFNESLNRSTLYGHGFRFDAGSDGNLVEANASFGGDDFVFSSSTGNTVIGNTATGNPDRETLWATDAFLFLDAPEHHVEGNTSVGSGGLGFRVDASPGVILVDNSATGSRLAGFGVREGSDGVRVGSNRSARNHGAGVLIMGSSGVTVDRNDIDRNDLAGIALFDAAGSTVARNEGRRNGGSGVLLMRSHGTVVERNVLRHNGQQGGQSAGIYVFASEGVAVSRNTACHNSLHDATEDAAPGTVWERNTFCSPLFVQSPHLEISSTGDFVRGFSFPPGSDLTLRLEDSLGDAVAFDPGVATDENGAFWWFVPSDVQPGFRAIETTSGRSVVAAELTYDSFDVDADTMAGTAPPFSAIFVRLGYDDETTEFEITTSSIGEWTAAAGQDIDHSFWSEVLLFEPDGDATVEERPPSPSLQVWPGGGLILGQDFGDGPVTVRVEGTDYEIHSDAFEGFRLEAPVAVGDEVVATGPRGEKSLTVAFLEIELFDASSDVVAGSTEAFTGVSLDLGDAGFYAESDEAGHWSAELAEIEYDLREGQGVTALVHDYDGDATIDLIQPEPTIRVNYMNDWVEGNDFSRSGTAVIEVVGKGSAEAEVGSDGYFILELNELGIDIEVDDLVRVDDGVRPPKDLAVADLTFDTFDTDTGVLGGRALEGTVVHLQGEIEGSVEADADDRWTFPAEGLSQDFGVDAMVFDDDGDATVVHRPSFPEIYVSVNGGPIWGNHFTGEVHIQLFDDLGTLVFEEGPVPVDEGGSFGTESGVQPQPGWRLEVSDGTTTKVLVVERLSFDTFDVSADRLAGDADGEVEVYGGDESGDFFEVVTADAGRWELNLSGSFDVTYETWVQAAVRDDDGDATVAERPPPTAIVGSLTGNWVAGQGFSPGESIDLTIDGTPFPGVATVEPWSGFWINVWDLGGPVLGVGTELVVTDGTNEASMTLEDISFEFDPDTGIASGTTRSDAVVSLGVWGDCGEEIFSTADTTGAWSIDIATGHCGGEFGSDFGIWARVYETDQYGNATETDLPALPTIRVNYQNDWVEGSDFTRDGTVTVTIGGADPVVATVGPNGYFILEPDALGIDIAVGDTVTVDDGEKPTKTLVVVPLTFDTFNTATGEVGGDAPTGETVHLQADVEDSIVAAGDRWSLIVAGLTEETYLDAVIFDEDGDSTIVHRPPPPPPLQLVGSYDQNWVWGQGFEPGATVDLTVGGVPVAGVVVDEFTEFFVDLTDLDPVPGTVITAFDGVNDRTLELTMLTASFDGVSVVSGTTAPDAAVSAGLAGPGCAEVIHGFADGDGIWSIDFSTGACGGEFGGVADVWANVYDGDGDSTELSVAPE